MDLRASYRAARHGRGEDPSGTSLEEFSLERDTAGALFAEPMETALPQTATSLSARRGRRFSPRRVGLAAAPQILMREL
jgi:hypothetical protein